MIYAIVELEVYKTKELSFLDKLIFERITALCHTNKFCYATNSYFANMYGVKNNAVTVAIRKLKKLGLIKINYIKDSLNKSKRYICLVDDVWLKEYVGTIPSDSDNAIQGDSHNNKYNIKENNNIIYSAVYKNE